MYLSRISIKDFRMFSDTIEISFSNGLNLLVGENGSCCEKAFGQEPRFYNLF